MKAEDKIIELLIEYIQKTDRTLAEMSKHEKQIDSAYQEIKALRQESLKREIQQEAILKEIFSISKRVTDLEK